MNNLGLSVSLKLFKALGDETRLRILLLLRDFELNVSELVKILGVHQSNISRHLNHLRESGLVQDHREGSLSWFRWSRELKTDPSVPSLLQKAFAEIADMAELRQAAAKIVDERKQEGRKFFDQIAGKYRDLARPGGGYEALLEASLCLQNLGEVADLGCGEGDLALILARHCTKLWAIDLSPSMLEIVRQKAHQANLDHVIQAEVGDIESLPLASQSIDLVILSQALHHASQPPQVMCEISRILKPGGRALILDLVAHEHEWMRQTMGDLWLGFDEQDLRLWASSYHLSVQSFSTIEPERGLPVLVLLTSKPPTNQSL